MKLGREAGVKRSLCEDEGQRSVSPRFANSVAFATLTGLVTWYCGPVSINARNQWLFKCDVQNSKGSVKLLQAALGCEERSELSSRWDSISILPSTRTVRLLFGLYIWAFGSEALWWKTLRLWKSVDYSYYISLAVTELHVSSFSMTKLYNFEMKGSPTGSNQRTSSTL